MGKLNEIQEQTTQSYGGNSFTTTIEETTVKFDSAKDSFTFADPVDVAGLTINGDPVPAGIDAQADWTEFDDGELSYIKNKPVDEDNNYDLGVDSNVDGTNNLLVGGQNTTGANSSESLAVGYKNTINDIRSFAAGANNTLSASTCGAIGTNGATITGQYSVAIGGYGHTIDGSGTVVLGSYNKTADIDNTVYMQNTYSNGWDAYQGVTEGIVKKEKRADFGVDATAQGTIALCAATSSYTNLLIKLCYCVKATSGSTITVTVKDTTDTIATLTCDGVWHEELIEATNPIAGHAMNVSNAVEGDTISYIVECFGK